MNNSTKEKRTMKRLICFPFLFLIIVVFAGVSYGQDTEVDKVGKLLDELSFLKATIAQEQKVQEGLDADKKLLDGQDRTIKSMDAQYAKDLPVYEMDLASQRANESSFEAGKNAYIAEWGCWDCRGKVGDEQTRNAQRAELSVLNPQNDRLNAEAKRLDAKHDDLLKTFNLLKEGERTLSKATLEWAAKKKTSNDKINELIAHYQELTKTYMDLIQRADLSEECKQIAYSNDRPTIVGGRVVGRQSGLDFGVLNSVMERAHHCLQKVWDGAK